MRHPSKTDGAWGSPKPPTVTLKDTAAKLIIIRALSFGAKVLKYLASRKGRRKVSEVNSLSAVCVTGADFRAKPSTWSGADEGGEFWDVGAGKAEAGAEVVEEGDFEFHAGLGEAEHGVAGLAAFFADGPTGDFALGDEGSDVVFGSVGVEGDFRPLEHARKFVLAREQAFQQTVERRIAGSAIEDAIELRAQEARPFGARRALVILQAPIEPPDHPLGHHDRVARFVVGGHRLVAQALRVDPPQRLLAAP